MQRIVTYKLIYELVVHLQLRNKNLSDVNIKQNYNRDGYTNVCQLCYDLIVAEHNLIDVEKEYSQILNM